MSWIGDVGNAIGDAWLWFNAARVASAAALGALVLAAITARVGVRTLDQNRRDSKARSRPTISAELRAVEHSAGTQSLVIRNTGPSIAKDVRVTFEPPIVTTPENPGLMTPIMLRRYSKPIPVMTPGTELDNLYYYPAHPGTSRKENGEPLPETVTVRITYTSDDGDPYDDVFPLDVDLLRARTYQTSSAAPEAQLKEGVKTLKAIAGSLKNVAESGAILTREERARRHAERFGQPTAEPEAEPSPATGSRAGRLFGRLLGRG